MKKYILDLTVTENTKLHDSYVLLILTHSEPLPEMLPGQFAEIRVDNSPTTFLRRPISINFVDYANLWSADGLCSRTWGWKYNRHRMEYT